MMLKVLKTFFLHAPKATVMLISALCFLVSSTYSHAQTSKKAVKGEATKDAGAEIDLSKVEWPEYYNDYAQGADFRKGRTLSSEEKYMAPYILSVPLILTPKNDQVEMLALWKTAIFSAFSLKENAIVKMQPVGEEANVPTIVGKEDPFNVTTVSGYASAKPGFELPEWVRPYLVDEVSLGRLFDFQYRLGNIIYCSDDIKFPLLINANATTQEEKLKEAEMYYNAIYWWAASYPELFYAIDDVNLKAALEAKNKELVYHYGRYRFPLDEESKTKMAKQNKSSNKIVQP